MTEGCLNKWMMIYELRPLNSLAKGLLGSFVPKCKIET